MVSATGALVDTSADQGSALSLEQGAAVDAWRAGVEPLRADDAEGATTLALRLARVAAQLAAAVDHCHARGVIHFAVRPANVMLVPGAAPRPPA